VLGEPSPGSPLIPSLLYSFFQLEFCCVTVAILVGAVAERGRLMPAMFFVFLWVTLVYAPVACWAWNVNGWASKFGVLDFAGGGPVEIGSGVGGLAYAWVIGHRNERELVNFRPHNVTLVTLGTFMLWLQCRVSIRRKPSSRVRGSQLLYRCIHRRYCLVFGE